MYFELVDSILNWNWLFVYIFWFCFCVIALPIVIMCACLYAPFHSNSIEWYFNYLMHLLLLIKHYHGVTFHSLQINTICNVSTIVYIYAHTQTQTHTFRWIFARDYNQQVHWSFHFSNSFILFRWFSINYDISYVQYADACAHYIWNINNN